MRSARGRRLGRISDAGLVDPLDGVTFEIERAFRRRLFGLRYLSRAERALAIRAAREWRAGALRELREKRSAMRQARRALRQHNRPAPP